MNDILNNPVKKPPPRIPDLFRELGDDAYFVNSDCINTKNHILVKNRIYQILKILDNAENQLTYIKFKDAYTKGYEVYIVGIEIVSGEVVYCHHRLNCELFNCDWIIIDLDLFEKEINEDLIRFSCKRKQPINDTSHE